MSSTIPVPVTLPHTLISSAADAYAVAVSLERRLAWSGVPADVRSDARRRRRRAWRRFCEAIGELSQTDRESFGAELRVSLRERLADERFDDAGRELGPISGG